MVVSQFGKLNMSKNQLHFQETNSWLHSWNLFLKPYAAWEISCVWIQWFTFLKFLSVNKPMTEGTGKREGEEEAREKTEEKE